MEVLASVLLALGLARLGGSSAAAAEKELDLTEYETYKDFNLTVVVLTMNRPWALARVLKSIAETEMERDGDAFDVEIHVDKSIGDHYQECVNFAKNFTLPHGGRVTAKIADKNRGLRAAWFEAWYPKPDDRFAVIVEDDLELSPFWFVWLRKAWAKYKRRDDVAGITLSRQYMKIQKPDNPVEIINEYRPFLYKFVGTWAFSPHPKHWREFLDWFHSVDNETFDPYVPGLATSDWLHQHTSMGKRHMTWEQWHVYYCEHHDQFTLYLNPRNRMTLAANWKENGVHTRGSANRADFAPVDWCAVELQDFPDEPRKYGWDAKEIVGDEEANTWTSMEFGSPYANI